MATEWKVGDKVTVLDGFSHRPLAIRAVTRVTKRFIELRNGSKWNHSGGEYPRRGDYLRPTIERTTAEHLRELRRRKRIAEISAWLADGQLYCLPDDTLDALHRVVTAAKAAQPEQGGERGRTR